MSNLGWAVVLGICVLLALDAAWSQSRNWWARRKAARQGRTLTTKFGLPPF
jgi:hypothetical protein